MSLNLYETRFSRFISLEASGASVDVDGDQVPEYVFRGVRARLRGLELDGRRRIATSPWPLDLTGGLDLVRGDNLDSGEALLPRLAPPRLRAGLEAGPGPWRAGAGLRHAARQDHVPGSDRATPGHTLLDLWLSWQQALPIGDALLYLKLDNATNTLACNAASVPTLRDLAPLPGRALSAGLRPGL